jgi:hypothetical protein
LRSLEREESSRVLTTKDNTWTKLSISQMIKTGSLCTETLRIKAFAFANRSVFKHVMIDYLRAEDGILHPKGALLSVIADGPHFDSELFDEPFKFGTLRFSRIREDSTLDAKEKSNLTTVSTGPQFLAFGHGRTACRGRFFLDFEFKMSISYLIMNYDIGLPKECAGKRPQSKWVAEVIFLLLKVDLGSGGGEKPFSKKSFVFALYDRNTARLEVNTYLHFRMSLVEIISKCTISARAMC